MKKPTSLKARIRRGAPVSLLCVCALLAGASPVIAGDTSKDLSKSVTPAEPEDTFNNWIEFGLGGVIYHGNRAAGQQLLNLPDEGGVFGGISDMHLERTLPHKWTATLDGHAMFNTNDYNLKLNVENPEIGYFRAGFQEFRTWYNGAGGFFPNPELPGDGVSFAPQNDELHIDRGDIWVELGLRMPNLPQVTFRYDHIWRYGQKDSTSWGDTNLIGTNYLAANTRKIVPSFRNINEVRDIFALDISKSVGITDIGLGVRWELTNNSDSFNSLFRPTEHNTTNVAGVFTYPDVKLDRYLTQTDTLKSDLFSTHATTETRFNDKVWLTTGYSFSTLNSDIGGDRIYGQNYGAPYVPLYGVSKYGITVTDSTGKKVYINSLPLAATASGKGWINRFGGSEWDQNEFNINLLYMPIPDLSILAGFRFDKENTDSVSSDLETNINTSALAYYNTLSKKKITSKSFKFLQPTQQPFEDSSDHTLQKLAESLELRYTGIKDWAFYTRADFNEDNENVHEVYSSTRLVPLTILNPAKDITKIVIQVPTMDPANNPNPSSEDSFYNTRRLNQKYQIGFNWYALPGLSFAGQYFHRIDGFDYDSPMNDGYMSSLDFLTDNVNFRITARPLPNLMMVSRYDFQRTKSFTDVSVEGVPSGAPVRNLGPEKSATSISHMFSEAITWNPIDRIYTTGNFSYVMDHTNTKAQVTIQDPTYFVVDPVTGKRTISSSTGLTAAPAYQIGNPLIGPVGLSFKNNYWQLGLGVGYAIDAKTDVHVDYNYYRANDYGNNDLFGGTVLVSQPYGAGDEEQTVSATLERQIFRNTRLTLRYSFTSYRDETSYGRNNFTAHQIFSGLMVRF